MVESKQNRVRLVVTAQKAAAKSFQECRDAERIYVLDLKALIVKRLGTQRANRYFLHFVHFLSSNLSKIELDKLVIATIGKKNVPLHNQLVRAILSNAIKAKEPPPLLPSSSEHLEKFSRKYQSPSVTSYRPQTSPSTLSNGDSFLSSPTSVKSTAHQNRDRDYRVSPLGHSEAHSGPHLFPSVRQPEAVAKQLDAESNSSLDPPTKRARVDCPTSEDSASAIESEVLGGDEICFQKEEREVPFLGNSIRESISFSSHLDSRVSGKRPTICAFPAHFVRQGALEKDSLGSNDLPDTDTMHGLVEQAAIRDGLKGASRESADVLNAALDAYLKRLIKSCMRERHAGPVDANTFQDCSTSGQNVNGGAMKVEPGVKGWCVQPLVDLPKRQRTHPPISLLNLKVAMDMNPQQLGGDWAVQLEKILYRLFDH